ncbi:MAG: TrkH family potassium uptake protein [Silicimonas sp.]|nr:TrkH family potassium uptake protein [Silicimonas sp.]
MRRFYDLPFIVILIGMGAVAMLIPAIHGAAVRDYETARAFFYWAILFLFFFVMVALATSGMRIRRQGRSHLISITACLAGLPLMLAVPFAESVPDTRFLNAYVEMVSSLTTTGLTLFEPERLPPTVHLWRALVGWLGGLFIWVTAIAVMAPLNLGGFEVSSLREIGEGTRQIDRVADPAMRLRRYTARLFPIYAGLTLALWAALFIAGETPLAAICHAMSTLSTSGISPLGGVPEGTAGLRGELIIFIFFVFALSRQTFLVDDRADTWRSLGKDPELRLGVFIAVGVAVLLFLRHWAVGVEEGDEVSVMEGLRGLWGALFTVTSFLTTTGFVSEGWASTRAWSDFSSTGVLLLGLAVFGGGVATTAGGVKLLRVYALYRHGIREMEKLVMPSSLGSAGYTGRQFRRQGAYAAWVFFMLFAISIAGVMAALSLVGSLDFEDTMIITIASLSTTGPLLQIAGDIPVQLAPLSDGAKAIVSAAMILGRLETLAIIALLNPEFWR